MTGSLGLPQSLLVEVDRAVTIECELLWGAAFALALGLAARHLRGRRTEAALVVALALVAFAVRCAAPWGPLDFVEVERIAPAWLPGATARVDFPGIAMLHVLGADLGLAPAAVLRFAGPLLGAAAVLATYALARSLCLGVRWSALAAGVVLVSPLHVRFSGTGGLAVAATFLLPLMVALARDRSAGYAARVLGSAAVFTLLGLTRPELRLIAVLLLPLLPRELWRSPGTRVLVALAVLTAPTLPRMLLTDTAVIASSARGDYALPLRVGLTAWWLGPIWWGWLAALGLLRSRLSLVERGCLAAAVVAVFALYRLVGEEMNPVWSTARYHLAVLPLVAVSAAGAAARVESGPARALLALALAALTLASLPAHLAFVRRPVDLQAQLRFVRETTPWIAARHRTLVMLAPRLPDGRISVDGLASNVLFGMSFAGLPVERAGPCAGFEDLAPVEVATDVDLLRLCPVARPGRSFVGPIALFLGLYRDPARLARLRERFDLSPIVERRVAAAPVSGMLNVACRVAPDQIGGQLRQPHPDCPVTFGWSGLTPRSPSAAGGPVGLAGVAGGGL